MPESAFCACVGREADAKPGHISVRRGALPITTPPDHNEIVNGLELFKGGQPKPRPPEPRRRLPIAARAAKLSMRLPTSGRSPPRMFDVMPALVTAAYSNGLLWQVPESGSTNPPGSGAPRLNNRPNHAFWRRIKLGCE